MTRAGFYNGLNDFIKRNGLERVPRSQALYAYKAWLNRNYVE